MPTPEISIIIPVYNEKRNIRSVINNLKALDECQVIVVDGGSTDGTIEEASDADLKLCTNLGRAVQQNAGADEAVGSILIFLHADCELKSGFSKEVEECLSRPGVVAGCFSQHIDHSARKYRMIEKGNAWRVRNLGWIYGDQGLFIKKELFDRLGGFPAIPLMEDLYFSKRLKKTGQLVVSAHEIKVSARRWEKNGVLRQTMRNWSFVALSHLGVKPQSLANWYGHVREVTESISESD